MKKPAPKALAAAFEKFALAGYPLSRFTVALYNELSRSFGFIAHYNREGFYLARFATPEARADTFAAIMTGPLYRMPFDGLIRKIVTSQQLLAKEEIRIRRELEAHERAELARLKAKYEEPGVMVETVRPYDLRGPQTVQTVPLTRGQIKARFGTSIKKPRVRGKKRSGHRVKVNRR